MCWRNEAEPKHSHACSFTCLFTQYARTCARATQCKHILPLTRSSRPSLSLSKKINKNRMRCNENKETRFITPSKMMKYFLRLFTCALFRKAMKCNANDDLPSPPTHSHSMNNLFFRCESAFRFFQWHFFPFDSQPNNTGRSLCPANDKLDWIYN